MSNQAQGNPFFTPTQISGCALWLDAADRSSLTFSSGTNVSTWADKSGGGYNVTQGTSTRQPTYNATNRQLLFSGDGVQNSSANQALQNTSIPVAGTAYTIFSVAKGNASQPSFTGYNYMIAPAVTFPQARLAFASLTGNFATFTGTGTTFNDTNANTPNISVRTTTRIWCMVVSGSTLTPFYDGISMNTKVGTTGSFTGLVVGDAFSTDSGQCWNGSMNEILFYNSALSTNERQQIEGYLAWKWGLQANLPANHPYKSSPIPPLLNPPRSLPSISQNTSIVSWSPFQIPGCTVWLDAADSTTLSLSGTTVNSWNSKVSSVPLLASSVGFGSIVYSNYNNFPSLYFNGTNTKMTTGTVPSYGATGTTWITVSANFTPITSTTPVDSSAIIATLQGTSPERSIRYQYLNQFTIYCINNGFLRGVIDENTNGIRGFSDQSASFVAYVNGNIARNDTNPATYQAGVNQAFQLGQWGSSGYLLGHIQEVIIYNSRITLTQYQTVEGYLAWKWGLQGLLPASHPFKNNPPLGNPLAPLARSIAINTVWQPNQISGLNAWFDGADPNGNGIIPRQNTAVSTWVNKRSGGTNATAVGTGAIYSSNGITFATPKYYTTSISYSTNYSIFIVATNTTNTPCYTIARNSIGGGRGPTFTQGYTNATRLQFYEGDGGVFPIIQDPTASPFITSVNYTSLGPINLYYNGTNTSNTTSTATYNSAAWDTIGQAGAGVNTGYYNGTMKELIFYNTILTTQQRQNVEGYLAWKWGLQGSLPANHPFKRWPPSP